MLPVVFSGFILGFAGSLHCIGMCGPLSMALPAQHLTASTRIIALFIYQAGRIITYGLLGLLSGLAGRGVYLAGFQQWFSISLGIFILLFAAIHFVYKSSFNPPFLMRGYVVITRLISGILKKPKGLTSFLLLGMANGLLPCGMVYIALAATLSFHTVYESIFFMSMFGAGTLPLMMLVGIGAHVFSRTVRNIFSKSIPYIITITGLLLIIRGLHLGIAFISPQSPNTSHAVLCH